MKAEIITSGTELLLGEISDTNTSYIARQLATLGINLYYSSIVGDNFERYSKVLKQAWDRSDLIITTGGLGPTQGDITREVIAGLVGEKMEIDPDLKKDIIAFFNRVNLEMPDNNLKQATLIPSAMPLHNNSGTAPGWWVEKDRRIIIALPGPPAEMQNMWDNLVSPRMEAKGGAIILSRILKTWGLSEGAIDEMMSPFLSLANPTLGIYARRDGIQLRITARADTREAAAALISGREQEIREVLRDNIWGIDDETYEGVVGQLLSSQKLSIAVTESFTSGLLANAVSNFSNEPGVFKGGLVITSEARKNWGLEKASTSMAKKMASLARERFNADIGLAIDGSVNPDPGMVGGKVFIAIDTGKKTGATRPGYPGRPEWIARRSVIHAIMYLKDFIEKS
jgi:nicotinamide-nucleotide amidase